MFNISFADDWIWTSDLWCRKDSMIFQPWIFGPNFSATAMALGLTISPNQTGTVQPKPTNTCKTDKNALDFSATDYSAMIDWPKNVSCRKRPLYQLRHNHWSPKIFCCEVSENVFQRAIYLSWFDNFKLEISTWTGRRGLNCAHKNSIVGLLSGQNPHPSRLEKKQFEIHGATPVKN